MEKLKTVQTGGNVELSKIVYERLVELGYCFKSDTADYSYIAKAYCLYPEGYLAYCASDKIYGDKISIDDVLFTNKYRLVKPEKVVLTDEYTAVIDKTGIKVGCQSFSFEKFDELAASVKKIRDSIE